MQPSGRMGHRPCAKDPQAPGAACRVGQAVAAAARLARSRKRLRPQGQKSLRTSTTHEPDCTDQAVSKEPPGGRALQQQEGHFCVNQYSTVPSLPAAQTYAVPSPRIIERCLFALCRAYCLGQPLLCPSTCPTPVARDTCCTSAPGICGRRPGHGAGGRVGEVGCPTTQELWTAALEYAVRGWHVMPLHDVAQGDCSCGILQCGCAAHVSAYY